MNVCPHCFNDKELVGFISTSNAIGDCSVCQTKNVPLLPIDELTNFFIELLECFQKSKTGMPLKTLIQSQWNLFASSEIATTILDDGILTKVSNTFSSSENLADYADDITANYSYWNELKNILKWSQRYFPDLSYLEDLGWDGFFNTQFQLQSGINLYRGRVHHQSGLTAYSKDRMMSPERQLVKAGRANPQGIPYLYLCEREETVLYEVRAAFLDELSIGVFEVKESVESIKIVDFTEETFLFQPGNVSDTIKAKLLRDIISLDLSKPMRRYDSELEYIPTQFICEYIKIFTGSSGIRFQSSLHPKGKNIVVFDQSLVECKNVRLKKVVELQLRSEGV